MPSVKNLRWWIAGLLALATTLNYLDRHSFPVVVGEIKKEIPLSNEQYGRLTSNLDSIRVCRGGKPDGRLVEQFSDPAFIVAGVLHPLAFILILAVVKHIEPVARFRGNY